MNNRTIQFFVSLLPIIIFFSHGKFDVRAYITPRIGNYKRKSIAAGMKHDIFMILI
jgi:hypothetical protein